jgi:hypothetical protein
MAQFVTAQQVIENSFTNTKTDTNLIKTTTIEQTQLNHLKPVLTEDLYDLIVTENNASSLSAANQTLFDTYIVPAMYWFVKYDVLIDMHNKSTSLGVQRNFGEFNTTADNNDVAAVMMTAFMRGVRILERMTKYIEDNSSDYSTYSSGENVLNDVTIRGGIIY